VLTLGARLLTQTQAEEVLRTWVATPFAGGRHQARVQKILDIERKYFEEGPVLNPSGNWTGWSLKSAKKFWRAWRRPRRLRLPGRAKDSTCRTRCARGACQRCAQTCSRNTREIIAAGADRVSASERLTKNRPGHRVPHRPHHSQARSHAQRPAQGVPRGAPVQFRQRVREPLLGPLVRAELAGSPVKICTVVGFPLGATSTAAKVAETVVALRDGAQEIDMVIKRRRAALGR